MKTAPLPIPALILNGSERPVKYLPKLDRPNWVGSYEEISDTISILRSLEPAVAFRILIHEITHYLWAVGHFNHVVRMTTKLTGGDANTEEFFVGVLSQQLWAFLCANREQLRPLGAQWDTLLTPNPASTSPAQKGKRAIALLRGGRLRLCSGTHRMSYCITRRQRISHGNICSPTF